jgi:type 1 glutamine amidotransferase
MLLATVLIRVLIVTGQTDLPYHDWRESVPFLRRHLEETGRFEVRVLKEPRALNRAALEGYDAILWHYNGPRLPRDAEQAVEEFVAAGRGFVSFHGVTYGAAHGQTRRPDMRWEQNAAAWPAFRRLVGAAWKVENIGHSLRHAFPVKYIERGHPVARNLPETFLANDELYHRLDLEPDVTVIARAWSDPSLQGTGREEPMAWTGSFGKGRIAHTPLGHDLSAMAQPGFLVLLSRMLEWAATGNVEAAPPARPERARVLVVTGGHSYPSAFFSLFDDPRIDWVHAGSQPEAFGQRLAGRYDAIVFHDMAESIGEKEQKNLQEFVENGGGIVSIHHAIVNYTSWPWWYEEVIGGKFFTQDTPQRRRSLWKDDVEMVAAPARGAERHPVLRGVPPLPVKDEAYRNMWHSPRIQVLMEVRHPENDPPVVYIGPHPKARSVYIQLGHSAETILYPGYQRLVRNAILWTARKLPEP